MAKRKISKKEKNVPVILSSVAVIIAIVAMFFAFTGSGTLSEDALAGDAGKIAEFKSAKNIP